MSTRHGRKSNKDNKALKTLGLLLLMGLLILAWQRYDDNLKLREAAQAPPEYIDLTDVKMPTGVKSELLEYPGFTMSFNAKHHQPNYVAWELTRQHLQQPVVGKRSDNFRPDDNVKECPTLDDYRNSGYDRGHMAPAGDMKWDQKAADACFLLTNMSPQHHALNSGSWKALEEKCRDWAIRDSLLVIVCGPILTDVTRRHIGDSKVTVPERYFKVVLAPYADPPRGIGFIMNNGKVNGGMQAAAVSIDEVERVTRYDFFSSLPDDIEEAVEKENNFAQWDYK